MQTEQANLATLLDQLAGLIAAQVAALPVSIDLWGTDEIARYLKLSRKVVTDRVTQAGDFPAPIRISGNGRPRWKAREVIKWAESYQERR